MAKAKNKSVTKTKSTRGTFVLSVYFLVIAVCFIIPFSHFKTTLDPVLYPRLTLLGLSLLILSVLMFFEKSKSGMPVGLFKNGFFLAFLFFILVSIISLYSAVNPIEGLTDILKWSSMFLLMILATWLMIRSEYFFPILLKGIIINAFVVFLIGVALYFEKAFLSTDPNALYEVKGLMAHKNQFSISLFVLLPFLFSGIFTFHKSWRSLAILSSVLVFSLIILLQTRAVWIALLVSTFITTVAFFAVNKNKGFIKLNSKKQKQFFLIAILLVVFVGLFVFVFPVGPFKIINERINTIFNPQFTSNEWRVEMWNATLQLAKEKPIFGVGAGNWKISVYPYYSEYLPSVYRHWRNPHNDYLLTFSEKGIGGLLAFVSMFVILLYFGIRNLLRSESLSKALIQTFFVFGIIAYMLVSFFSFPNERINHLIFISLIAASILSEYLKPKVLANKNQIRGNWIFVPILVLSYLVFHFGIISMKSEINVKKAQIMKLKKDWNSMAYFAEKAYSPFAPIEAHNSYPVSMYSGMASFSQGDFKDALTAFKRSYHQHPTHISVLNNLGSVYGALNEIDSSMYYHQKTLEIFPHYEFGIVNLTKTYYLQKDYELAYQMILRCDPKSTNREVFQLRAAIENELD